MIDLEQKPVAKKLPRFVPVIFANGEDDDAVGIQACLDDEPVQFDDRVYETGEDIDIVGRDIVLSRTVIASRTHGRHTHFERCFFRHV